MAEMKVRWCENSTAEHLARHAVQHAAALNSGHIRRAGGGGKQGQHASSRRQRQRVST